MGTRGHQVHNPPTWTRVKAEAELGHNFTRAYNKPEMQLQEKIAILPMLIVLNNKNS